MMGRRQQLGAKVNSFRTGVYHGKAKGIQGPQRKDFP